VKLLRTVSAIKGPLANAFRLVLLEFNIWLAKDLKRALIYGGLGIEGITQTSFYQWLTSEDGLSQLGIPADEPPKLLAAYDKTFRVDTRGFTTKFDFGNVYNLLQATPHPANGTGQLKIKSWMSWVIDGKVVPNYGYVPRNKLPNSRKLRQHIRLNDPLGGLMLRANKFGSTGHWALPAVVTTYADQWFISNQAKIEAAMQTKLEEIFTRRLAI